MDSRLLLSWMRACYIHHRDGIFFTEKTLLVMASSNENVASDMEPLLGTTTTMPAIIPEGMTQQLQPLDMGVKTVFKHHLHRKWETHIKTGKNLFTYKVPCKMVADNIFKCIYTLYIYYFLEKIKFDMNCLFSICMKMTFHYFLLYE